jgi:hypothetical protein
MPLQDSNSTQAYNLCLLEWRWVSRPARVRNKDRSDFDKYCPQKIRQYWTIYIFVYSIFDFQIGYLVKIWSQEQKNSLDKELTSASSFFTLGSFWRFFVQKQKLLPTFTFCLVQNKNKPNHVLKKFNKTPSICWLHLNSEFLCH